jgi:predicted SAM-dependent methyltransferase
MKRINLGGSECYEGEVGTTPLGDEWEHVDIRPNPRVTHLLDVRDLPAEWEGQYDEVRASHIIEHIPQPELFSTFKGWVRILKHGGLMRIYCPDSRLLAKHLIERIISIDEYSRFMYGDQEYPENLHRGAFDIERLVHLVEWAGLTVISTNPRPTIYPYDIGVQAVKGFA